MNTGHSAGIDCFKIRYAADPRLSKSQSFKVLEIAEAQLVNDEKPSLCAQKTLGRKLGFTGVNYHKASSVLKKVKKLTSSKPSKMPRAPTIPRAPTEPRGAPIITKALTKVPRTRAPTEPRGAQTIPEFNRMTIETINSTSVDIHLALLNSALAYKPVEDPKPIFTSTQATQETPDEETRDKDPKPIFTSTPEQNTDSTSAEKLIVDLNSAPTLTPTQQSGSMATAIITPDSRDRHTSQPTPATKTTGTPSRKRNASQSPRQLYGKGKSRKKLPPPYTQRIDSFLHPSRKV